MRKLAYNRTTTIKPNPGGQAEFAADWQHFIVAMEGGWDCVSADTIISGTGKTAEELAEMKKPQWVWTSNGLSLATAPVAKKRCHMLTVELADGRSVTVAERHAFWGGHSWRLCQDFQTGENLFIEAGRSIKGIPVRKVRKAGKAWAFDLHVPGVHNYFANGVLSHNSGKTFIGARKLLTLHMHNAFDNQGSPTFVPSVAVAPTYGNAMDFVVPEIETAADECELAWKYYGSGNLANGRYSAPALVFPDLGTADNPSAILIRTADAPSRITGWKVGAAWGDEPARWKSDRNDPRNDAFTQLLGRVRHHDARFLQIMLTYTNEGDATSIYREMHRKGMPDRALYRASTRENPEAASFIARMESNLTPLLAEQYLGGGAVSLRGGRVYPSFNREAHVVKRVTSRFDLPLGLALDFNIAPGMHGEIVQWNPELDCFSVLGEIYGHRMDVRGLTQAFELWVRSQGGWKWPQLHIFGDSSGRSGNAATGDSCYDVLLQGLTNMQIPFRVRVPRHNPPVVDRVNAVECALLDLQGKKRLQIAESCQCLITDLQEQKRNAKGEIDKTNEEISHASEALGYMVWYLRPIRPARVTQGEARFITAA